MGNNDYVDMIKDNDVGILSFLLICLILLTVYYIKYFGIFSRKSNNIARNGAGWNDGMATAHRITLVVSGMVILFIGAQVVDRLDGGRFSSGLRNRWESKVSAIGEGAIEKKYGRFNVLGYSFLKHKTETKSADNFNCDTVQFSDFLEASQPQNITTDLKAIRKQVKKISEKEYPIAKLCFFDTQDKSEDEIVTQHWWNFCGSSVWLSKHQVHFYTSRVVVSESGARNNPTISLLHAQIFDKNWKKLDGFELTTSTGEVLKFPTLLKIRIDENPKGKNIIQGCEDPRVVLRRFKDSRGVLTEEPVVIFNMRSTSIKWYRAMHMYRPFTGETIRLSIKDRPPRFREKNWAPFFEEEDNDHIYFIYNFNPLRVLKCTMDKGECVKVTGPEFVDNKADETKHVSALRGGTDIVPIPRHMLPPNLGKRKFWFGIARSHIENCGCLKEIYRPHSFILSKDLESDMFSLDYVSSVIDFNIQPETWDPVKNVCDDGKSVLIPNSIAYWETFKDPKTGELSDIMTITLSEADRTNKLVHVKGFTQHVSKALTDIQYKSESDSSINAHYNPQTVDVENAVLGKCSTEKASQYCKFTEKAFNWNE